MPWRALDSLLSPAPDPARIAWLKGRDYAHRGLHGGGLPENSLAAFAGAIEAGMGIECDVQESADRRAVVFHDWQLDRLTAETGPVAERTAAQLAQVRLTGADERIPTLPDLLRLVRGRAALLIEIKTSRERRVDGLCRAVRRDLESYSGRVAVMGFDPRVCAWFRLHAPQLVRGLVVTEEGERPLAGTFRRQLALWHARPDFLAYDVRDLPSGFAARQRRRGLPVLAWTVRTAALRRLAAEHFDSPICESLGLAESRSSA